MSETWTYESGDFPPPGYRDIPYPKTLWPAIEAYASMIGLTLDTEKVNAILDAQRDSGNGAEKMNELWGQERNEKPNEMLERVAPTGEDRRSEFLERAYIYIMQNAPPLDLRKAQEESGMIEFMEWGKSIQNGASVQNG